MTTTAAEALPSPVADDPGAEERTGPTDEEMRADLRARGHNPTTRGRLGRDWVALWESGEGADQQAAGQQAAEGLAEGGVTAADFTGSHAEQVTGTGERRPGKPKARSWRERITGPPTGKKGKHDSGQSSAGRKAAAPKHARVSLDRLGEAAFDGLARATRAVDPALSRTFALEAPIAGPMVEDALAGTPFDKVLQPLARAQAKSRILLALFGMPLGIIGLEQAQTLPERQRLVREAMILPMLRECAVMWVEFAGDKLKEKAERDAARGPLYEEADELLAFLLYGQAPADPPAGAWTGPAAEAWGDEDQAADAAQQAATPGGFMVYRPADPPPARPQYAHPYPQASPAAQLSIYRP
jgi:hypothetical protein